MRAIIQVGSHQYEVAPGRTISMEKLDGPKGSEVRFNRILFYTNGKDIKTGSPARGAVYGKIVAQERAPKITVFKKTRRHGFHKKQGHRQALTKVPITRIEADNGVAYSGRKF